MSPRTTLTTIALGIATTFAITGVTLRGDVERDWRSMQIELERLQEERAGKSDLREAPYGETTEEFAWPHYDRALEELSAIGDVRDRARIASVASSEYEVRNREDLLLEATGVLAHLRRGAHARDATTTIAWEEGVAAGIPKLTDVRALCEIAVAAFDAYVDEGEDERAVEVLLDAQQFARDLASASTLIEEMIGCSQLVPNALDEHLATGRLGDVSVEAKTLWLAGLERIDAGLARGSASWRGELELMGHTLVAACEGSDGDLRNLGFDGAPGWRTGFSWRGATARYVLVVAELTPRVDAAFREDPPETIRILEELQAEISDDPNPLMKIALPKFASAADSRIRNLARLAFLRHALAVDLGRTTALPVDPYGNGVAVERTGVALRVGTTDRRGRVLEIVIGA